jgi:hypothetical protein
MALQGNLDDFSLPEILQLIAVQQKSGVLKLTAGDDLAVIFLTAAKWSRRATAGETRRIR